MGLHLRMAYSVYDKRQNFQPYWCFVSLGSFLFVSTGLRPDGYSVLSYAVRLPAGRSFYLAKKNQKSA